MREKLRYIRIGPKRSLPLAWCTWPWNAAFLERRYVVLSHVPKDARVLYDVFCENARQGAYTEWVVAPPGTYLPVHVPRPRTRLPVPIAHYHSMNADLWTGGKPQDGKGILDLVKETPAIDLRKTKERTAQTSGQELFERLVELARIVRDTEP